MIASKEITNEERKSDPNAMNQRKLRQAVPARETI